MAHDDRPRFGEPRLESAEGREYMAVVEHLLAFSHPLLSAWLSTRQASATFPWSHRERRARL